MREYVVEAIVLGKRSSREADQTVTLLTKEFGRVDARVVGGRRLLSKFSGHLDPLNVVTVRLVRKNHFTVADAVTRDRARTMRHDVRALSEALRAAFLLMALLPAESPDVRVWYCLLHMLRERDGDLRTLLRLLGYDPRHARCAQCGGAVTHFVIPTQSFLCAACAVQYPENALIYMGNRSPARTPRSR